MQIRAMRRALTLTLLALGSVACAPGARWERSGGTEAERRRDEAECAARANRDHSVPAQRIAARPGGGTSEGIELVTVRDFDSGAFDQCMRTRGYAQVPVRRPA
jgi:hypothetical protein